MSPIETTVAIVAALFLLWLAWRIGRFILRLLVGLLVLFLLGAAVWRFVLHKPLPVRLLRL